MKLEEWLRSQWDRSLAVVAAVAALTMLIVGWFGISTTPYPAAEIPYMLSAGVGSILLMGIGATLWLSADLRDEWRKLDMIDDSLRRMTETGSGDIQDLVVDPTEHDVSPTRSELPAETAPQTKSRPLVRANGTALDTSPAQDSWSGQRTGSEPALGSSVGRGTESGLPWDRPSDEELSKETR